MSSRKTTLFYSLVDHGGLARGRDGDCLPPRADAGLVGADRWLAPPPMNSAPLSGPVDASTFRNIAKTVSPAVVNIRSTSRQRAQEMTEFFRRRRRRPARALLRRPGRRQQQPPRPSARAGDAVGRHRLRDQPRRLHPHQQSRGRRRHQDRGRVLQRGSRRLLRGQGGRPRPADRQRPDSAGRCQAGSHRGEVRRLGANAARRLGGGDRQSLRTRVTP